MTLLRLTLFRYAHCTFILILEGCLLDVLWFCDHSSIPAKKKMSIEINVECFSVICVRSYLTELLECNILGDIVAIYNLKLLTRGPAASTSASPWPTKRVVVILDKAIEDWLKSSMARFVELAFYRNTEKFHIREIFTSLGNLAGEFDNSAVGMPAKFHSDHDTNALLAQSFTVLIHLPLVPHICVRVRVRKFYL